MIGAVGDSYGGVTSEMRGTGELWGETTDQGIQRDQPWSACLSPFQYAIPLIGCQPPSIPSSECVAGETQVRLSDRVPPTIPWQEYTIGGGVGSITPPCYSLVGVWPGGGRGSASGGPPPSPLTIRP